MSFLQDFWAFFASNLDEVFSQAGEHLYLTLVSLALATFIGVGLGLLLTRNDRLASPILGTVNIIQTIPSLALLGFLLPFLGIGEVPAIVALFLYALLPIVRNTYTGIQEVDPAVRDAAKGMGLSSNQRLVQVELPLALPVIFTGIRTSAVINVGVATLCALIAAGGLGEFIFRGIALNDSRMVLAGALPAAILAILFDFVLGRLQRLIAKSFRLGASVTLAVVVLPLIWLVWPQNGVKDRLVGGFPYEFIHRGDGYIGLQEHYQGLDLEVKEMEIGLMYQALTENNVDLISGFSTDGPIIAYQLRALEDDRGYFPPYHCAPLVRQATLERYSEIREVLNMLENRLSDTAMARLNYLVDQEQIPMEQVASDWLANQGFATGTNRETVNPQIRIGSKNFTESLLLGTLFGIMIENETSLDVDLKLGFGGTQLLYDALLQGEIDLYPEYTGTGLLVLLKADGTVRDSLGTGQEATYRYVQDKMLPLGLEWLAPLGFNNTSTFLMKEERARELGIEKISDLVGR
ncbi:MAG TPA: ABC transporter permease [Cytophagales bacterium]|nr:ABC transporter permease [Cytophagales bacterium]HAA22292.1 ABC transporter permease [Cytophagales bacterium]HAP60496.1 ABC transporter permease [Cytophagales bacterium]